MLPALLCVPLLAPPSPPRSVLQENAFLRPILTDQAEAEQILTAWLDIARNLDFRLRIMSETALEVELQLTYPEHPSWDAWAHRTYTKALGNWPTELDGGALGPLPLEPMTLSIAHTDGSVRVIDLPPLTYEAVVPEGGIPYLPWLGEMRHSFILKRARGPLRRAREARLRDLHDLALNRLPEFAAPGEYLDSPTPAATAIDRLERADEIVLQVADQLEDMRLAAVEGGNSSLDQRTREALNATFQARIDRIATILAERPVHGALAPDGKLELGLAAPLSSNDPQVSLSLFDLAPVTLGLTSANFDVLSTSNASAALGVIDTAMDSVGGVRLSLEELQQMVATGNVVSIPPIQPL